jgi:DGQHR domain-containing protein
MAKKTAKGQDESFQTISVIVPTNPFVHGKLPSNHHCLAALNVQKLMEWWPGTPHTPHRDPKKVEAIQRSLDWKRVAQIAAYLLQKEIVEAPDKLDKYFSEIYKSTADEPGRQWPPQVPRVVKYQPSEFPTFSNVLLHVNGATLMRTNDEEVAKLQFDESNQALNFSVIDGQHRINGAYFAVSLLQESDANAEWEIPAEIFIDLDAPGAPPRHQAQIFIDVNFYQKKVDRSLVADLFPTARDREALDDKERAQDLGRRLMLDIGPLVGMVQIPGIKYGVKDVVTLATLNRAIEDVLPDLRNAGIENLEAQAEFLAQCLDAWLVATGRKEDVADTESLDPENVAYQGRAIVSFLTLIPACIWRLKTKNKRLISHKAMDELSGWLADVMKKARLMKGGKFLAKGEFRSKGFLGSGGLGRFRDSLWAAVVADGMLPARIKPERLAEMANKSRADVWSKLGSVDEDR